MMTEKEFIQNYFPAPLRYVDTTDPEEGLARLTEFAYKALIDVCPQFAYQFSSNGRFRFRDSKGVLWDLWEQAQALTRDGKSIFEEIREPSFRRGQTIYRFDNDSHAVAHAYTFLGSLREVLGTNNDDYFIVVKHSGGFPERVYFDKLEDQFFLDKEEALGRSKRIQLIKHKLKKIENAKQNYEEELQLLLEDQSVEN